MKLNILNKVFMICVFLFIIPIIYKYTPVGEERENVPASVQISKSEIIAKSSIYLASSKNSDGVLIIDNGDDTLTNGRTNLMWQKRITSSQLNWKNACNYCDHLNFAGYDDWRMPEADEYFELVDGEGSTISRGFKNYSVQQWTITNYPKRRNYVVTVEFEFYVKYNGFLPQPLTVNKKAKRYIRCVR